jgi:multiple sugar transport system permease protein
VTAATPEPAAVVADQLARGEDPTLVEIPRKPFHSRAGTLLVYLALLGLAFLYFTPFIWSFLTSLKDLPETTGFDLWPDNPDLQAYREVLTDFNFARFAANSFGLAATIAFFDVFLSSLGGYAFARLQFPGREVLFILVLSTLMIPDQLRLVPVYQMLTSFPLIHYNFVGTYQGYVLIKLVSAANLFFMRQYFLTIPKDFEEAARLDGAGFFKTYLRVMLPLAAPAVAAVAILSFEGAWNDFFWALVILGFGDPDHYTLPLGIAQFKFQYQTLWPQLMAASILATLPIAIIYIIFQRFFVAGVVSAGVKG